MYILPGACDGPLRYAPPRSVWSSADRPLGGVNLGAQRGAEVPGKPAFPGGDPVLGVPVVERPARSRAMRPEGERVKMVPSTLPMLPAPGLHFPSRPSSLV